MWPTRRWAAAHAEHEIAVAEFLELVRSVPASRWHQPLGPGRWSPAALTLHVVRTYEFGRAAATGAPGMQLRVPPITAWLARQVLLPVLLATHRFPRGVEAPIEVVPDLVEARTLTPASAAERLRRAADAAAAALARTTGRQAPRVMHAYFGALPARQALRLLSAHTRHHAPGLLAARGDPHAG